MFEGQMRATDFEGQMNDPQNEGPGGQGVGSGGLSGIICIFNFFKQELVHPKPTQMSTLHTVRYC
jgi:hypothetical protein